MRNRLTATFGVLGALLLLAAACTTASRGTGGSGSTNTPPTAVIVAAPTAGSAPLDVDFSGVSSVDPGGHVVAFAWTFGDGAGSSAPEIGHTYTAPGSYTATLTVTDDGGATDSDSVTIEVVPDFSAVVLVDAVHGADSATCGTPTELCASIGQGLDRAAAGAKTQVWVTEGTYPAFTVKPGIDVRGGYDGSFASPGAATVVNGSFNPASGVSAAITAADVQTPTTISALTALGGDESTQGRTALAAYVSGSGSGLSLDDVTLTGGQNGAAATALLVDGASTVALSAPTITSGDATGAGNSSYGIRAVDGATVTVDGGTIVSGSGAAGTVGGAAPAAAAAGCGGTNGANASGAELTR